MSKFQLGALAVLMAGFWNVIPGVLGKDEEPYVPFFPLGGFNPLQSASLDAVAASLGATPMQIALEWLLQRSPNVLLIPGTSSVQHLRENLAAAKLTLPADALAKLDGIAATVATKAS